MQIYFIQNGLTDFSEHTKDILRKEIPFATISFAPHINYNAEVIISYPQNILKLNISDFPRLKVIHLLSAGYDELDLELLKARNIRLFNARATSSTAIAELVIGQILNMNYNLTVYHRLQEQKIWHRHFTSIELAGSKAIILGSGAIGQAIAKRLKLLGVHVTGYRRRDIKTPHFHEMIFDLERVKDLLPTFDYVILALPLSKDTKNVVDYSWFLKMKPSALFINIARGDIVVEGDLNKALNEALIRGAILDVTKKEPLPIDSPLWSQEHIRLTPHVAFYSNKYLDNVLNLIINNLHNYKQAEKVETEVKL